MKHTKRILTLPTIALLLASTHAFAYKTAQNNQKATTALAPKARISHANVVTAIESDGDLSTLAAALKANGLDKSLVKTDVKYTVFAPTNAAIAKVGAQNVTADILKSHVVSGKKALTLKELESRKRLNTLSGTRKVDYKNHHVYIDGVKVARVKEIITKNGNVYVIDEVLQTKAQ